MSNDESLRAFEHYNKSIGEIIDFMSERIRGCSAIEDRVILISRSWAAMTMLLPDTTSNRGRTLALFDLLAKEAREVLEEKLKLFDKPMETPDA